MLCIYIYGYFSCAHRLLHIWWVFMLTYFGVMILLLLLLCLWWGGHIISCERAQHQITFAHTNVGLTLCLCTRLTVYACVVHSNVFVSNAIDILDHEWVVRLLLLLFFSVFAFASLMRTTETMSNGDEYVLMITILVDKQQIDENWGYGHWNLYDRIKWDAVICGLFAYRVNLSFAFDANSWWLFYFFVSFNL